MCSPSCLGCAFKEGICQMLGNMAYGECAGFGAARAQSRSRMRKPWEFTWDDSPQETAGEAFGSVRSAIGELDNRYPAADVIARTRISRRMRRAWEFTWDDEGGELANDSVDASPRQLADAQPATPDKRAAGVVADVPVPEAASPRPRRRRKRTVVVEAAPAAPANMAAAPVSDMVGDVIGEASESGPASVPASTDDADIDLDGVLRRLEAMGGSGETSSRQKADDQRVEWVKARRGARSVQVVHVGSAQKGLAVAAQSSDKDDQEPSLQRDPLVLRAVRLVELLRGTSTENRNIGELRKAVREMRDAVAGVEAQAFAGRQTKRVPLFFQAYDRRTRTG